MFRKRNFGWLGLFSALLIQMLICSSAFSDELWISDGNGVLGRVDVTTGNVTIVGNMGVTMYDIAFSPTGDLYGLAGGKLYAIDPFTAQIYQLGNSLSVNSLVFDSTGTLYAASNSLSTINRYNGASTSIGNGGTSYNSAGDLAFVGGTLYLAASGGGSNSLYMLDTTTGAGYPVGGTIGFTAVYGLATPDNVILYGVAGQQIITIDTVTGLGSSPVDYSGQGLGYAFGTAFLGEADPCPVDDPPPDTFDIAVEKERSGSDYAIRVWNNGAPINGVASIELIDYVPFGLTVTGVSPGPGWTCSPGAPIQGPDVITCHYVIASGATFANQQFLPDVRLEGRGEPECANCARVRLYSGDLTGAPSQAALISEANANNNVSCSAPRLRGE